MSERNVPNFSYPFKDQFQPIRRIDTAVSLSDFPKPPESPKPTSKKHDSVAGDADTAKDVDRPLTPSDPSHVWITANTLAKTEELERSKGTHIAVSDFTWMTFGEADEDACTEVASLYAPSLVGTTPTPSRPGTPVHIINIQDHSKIEAHMCRLHTRLRVLCTKYRKSLGKIPPKARKSTLEAIRKQFDIQAENLLCPFEAKVEGTDWSGMGSRILADLTFRMTPTYKRAMGYPNSPRTINSANAFRRTLIHELDHILSAREVARREVERDFIAWEASVTKQIEEATDTMEELLLARWQELRVEATTEEFEREWEEAFGEMLQRGESLASELEKLNLVEEWNEEEYLGRGGCAEGECRETSDTDERQGENIAEDAGEDIEREDGKNRNDLEPDDGVTVTE